MIKFIPKLRPLAALLALLTSALSHVAAMNATEGGPLPQPLPLFPADNWWNQDISTWPVDPGSASYIALINNGGTRHLHPDLGGNAPTQQDPYACYGMPYAVVSGVTSADLVAVQFQYSSESDGVDHTTDTSYPFYPIPPTAITQPYWIEGGDPGNVDLRSSEDRHLLIVDSGHNYLYELYNVFYSSVNAQWYAGSGAFFDMNTDNRRPDGWTSADAAGLAILPGLIRYDEVYDPTITDIGHAFRVTVRSTDGYVYPASHQAGSTAGALPMGARLRLKASVDVTQRTSDPNLQKLFRAMQKRGLIVADNGSDMYITGTYDTRWNNSVLNPAFSNFSANDFEVIQLGYNPPSGTPTLSSLSLSSSTVTGGAGVVGTITLNAPAPPPTGTSVTLTSDQASVTVPGSVAVLSGSTSANFNVGTSPVAAPLTANIAASDGTVTIKTILLVNPPALVSLGLNPTTVDAGSPSTGTVTLSGSAPSGGTAVKLSSSKTSLAAVPMSVTVPQGKTSATFTVTTSASAGNSSVTITASLGTVSQSATLGIRRKKH
jgi:hypothetical protein